MSIRTHLSLIALLAASVACFGNADTEDTDPEGWCDDMPGISDEVINVLGNWSGSFNMQDSYDNSCGSGGPDETSFGFFEGAIEIDGYTPDGIKIIFQGDRPNRLQGIIHPTGGITFSGQRPSAWGEMHIAIGGHTYTDAGLDRTTIQGYAYVGMDTTGDGHIDCDVRGDWKAIKSGV